MDTIEAYRALRTGAGVVRLPRDVLRVAGPDAVKWLHGQLSQNVAGLAVGGSADSFLLQPQGKVDAFLRVTRAGADEVVLDVDAGFGDAVEERLRRFKIRVKAEIERLAWRCVAVRGPGAHEAAAGAGGVGAMSVGADWPGLPGVDLLGEDPDAPAGVAECGLDVWEVVRIEAGIPAMGAELTERTIPAEAGVVERAVSFTKGCYTGQELVARIDSRGGNVPRRLRGLVVEAGAGDGDGVRVGAAVVVAGKEAGQLTSVAVRPGGEVVALAYVRRDVEPPAEAVVRWEGGEAPARVESLPLVG